MNYSDFVGTIRAELKLRTQPGTRILIQKLPSNNGGTRDCLAILPKGRDLSPTLPIEDYYKRYLRGCSLPSLLEELLETYSCYMLDSPFTTGSFHNFSRIRSRLACKLVRYRDNEEFLKRFPHRLFLDLAAACFFLLEDPDLGPCTVPVYREHLSLWNITEEELLTAALANTPHILPPILRPMDDLMKELLTTDFLPERDAPEEDAEAELLLSRLRGSQESSALYVVSNYLWKYGASVLLYPDLLSGFARQMNSDFYVLPCSIHEVILVPEPICQSPKDLNRIVHSINESDVPPKEQLSDHIYHYSSETEALTFEA